MRHLQKANIAVPITASSAHVQKAGDGPSSEAFGDLSGLSRANGSFGVGNTDIVRAPVSNATGTVAEGARDFPVQVELDPTYLGGDGLRIMGDVKSTALPLNAFDNSGSPRSEPSRHLRAGVGFATEIDQDMTEICILGANVERGGMLDLSMDVGAACGLSLSLTQPSKPRIFDTSSRRFETKNGDVPGADTFGAKLVLGLG